jgi:heptosyltransferase-2
MPNWLGDALLARPLLHDLARRFPVAERVAVGPGFLLSLLDRDGAFTAAETWPGPGSERSALAARLRSTAPDAAVVLPPSFSSALWAWRTGARERIGYAHEMRSPLLTRALRRPARGDVHLSEEYRALGRAVPGGESVADPFALPCLEPSVAGTAAADAILARRGFGGARLAVLGPGAIYGPAKRWPVARFVEVGRRLAAGGRALLVCGVSGERDTCSAVARGIGDAACSLAGDTDLACQTALCARAEVAVCNDSGLAHLAAATGTPTIAVFGSTSSAWTAPLGPRTAVVQDAPVCSPCFQRTCRIGTVCLEAVSVAGVLRAAATLGVAA